MDLTVFMWESTTRVLTQQTGTLQCYWLFNGCIWVSAPSGNVG